MTRTVAVFIEDAGKFKLLVNIRDCKFVLISDVLDWYAQQYGFPREKLMGTWIDEVAYDGN